MPSVLTRGRARPNLDAMRRLLRGVRAAVRRRPGMFLGVAAAVVALNVLLPPLVLSLSRKPVDYFTFNPWLKRLPEFLASNTVPLERKLDFLPGMALFWFSADGVFGADWGFTIDVLDAVRIFGTGLLVAAYFVLWRYRRDRRAAEDWGVRLGRPGGVAGAFATVLGLSTGPCSVVGCGAPVIPVVGLAFTGLTSGTLTLLSRVSRIATVIVLVGLMAGTVYLAWRAGADTRVPA